jgi:hypothetical protein
MPKKAVVSQDRPSDEPTFTPRRVRKSDFARALPRGPRALVDAVGFCFGQISARDTWLSHQKSSPVAEMSFTKGSSSIFFLVSFFLMGGRAAREADGVVEHSLPCCWPSERFVT